MCIRDSSGSINNQKDIYLLSANTSNMKKLTDDLYDDIYPQFFPNSTSIVFSSNRTNPSLNQTTHTEIEEYYNLFVYNLDTTKNSLHQITKTISNDIKPMSLSKNKLVYLSDLKGIYNLYSYSTTDGYKQISNFKSKELNECVRDPIEILSTPVFAIFFTFFNVMPPEASVS